VTTLTIQVNQNFSIVISQVIRMFIGIFPDHILRDEDFVVTSDSDLAPLKASYCAINMNQAETSIIVWNAFCCRSFKHSDKKNTECFQWLI
jgi:hypothetical protein